MPGMKYLHGHLVLLILFFNSTTPMVYLQISTATHIAT
jgi:hypothetical protein